MTDRKFGVEVECGFHREMSTDQLEDELENIGLHEWTVDHDGTYIEARTPVLSGPEGLAVLKKGMELFVVLDGYVTRQDGLHVHHDAPEFVNDMDAIIRLVRSWHANQAVIDTMVAPERVNYYDACPPWREEAIEYLVRNRDLATFSRNTLNITSLASHGTIEIRQHEGTLDYPEAEAWVLFGQSFIEDVVAAHTPTPVMGSTDLLLERIRIEEKSGAFLRAKAARKAGL